MSLRFGECPLKGGGQALGGGGWFYREGLGQSVNHDVQCVYVHFPVYPFQ